MLRCRFDGYAVGDRLLEGVMFEVMFDEATLKVASVQPFSASDDSYLNQLNKALWLTAVEQFVNEEMSNTFSPADQKGPHYVEELTDWLADVGCDVV